MQAFGNTLDQMLAWNITTSDQEAPSLVLQCDNGQVVWERAVFSIAFPHKQLVKKTSERPDDVTSSTHSAASDVLPLMHVLQLNIQHCPSYQKLKAAPKEWSRHFSRVRGRIFLGDIL